MSEKLYSEESLQNIANSIRANGMSANTNTYKAREMAQGITDMADDIKDTLYNYLPTNTVTNGVCENAVDLPIKSGGVYGNSYQAEEPTPTNPQDIEVVETTNILPLYNYNRGNSAGINWKMQGNTIFANGTNTGATQSATASYGIQNLIFKLPKGTYILSGGTSILDLVLMEKTGDTTAKNVAVSKGTAVTFTTTEDKEVFYRGATSSSSVTYDNVTIYANLTKGTTEKPYLPYGSIGLEHSGKNWFNKSKEVTINGGANITELENGIRATVSYTTASATLWSAYVLTDLTNYVGKTIRFKSKINKSPNGAGKYYIGLCNADGSNRTVKELSNDSDKEISFVVPTLNGEQKYLILVVYSNTGSSATKGEYVDYIEPILTIDNEDMTYEPYHETKLIPINLNGNTLVKVGTVRDKLKIYRSGKVEIEKKIGKVVLNGSETYTNIGTGVSGVNRFTTKSPLPTAVITATSQGYVLCNRLKEITNDLSYSGNQGIHLRTNGANQFVILITGKNTTSEFVSYITSNNLEIYYVLKTPQTIQLPSIEPIETFTGTNTFKLISNLDTDYEIEYITDVPDLTTINNELDTIINGGA